MTIRLVCIDGVVTTSKEYFEKSIFNNPEIADTRSYTLQCKPRFEAVNAVLDVADGESEKVTITKDNFEELQSLCKELGFRGLDKQLRAFLGETWSGSVDLREFLQLKERVTRQEKRLNELERQLSEVLSWKRKAESVSREVQSLEIRVEEVARVCEERNVETSRKMERALKECAKQCDLEELAQHLADLKESENGSLAKTEFQSHGRKVEEVARVSEWQNEISESDVENLRRFFDAIKTMLPDMSPAQAVDQARKPPSAVQMRPVRSLDVIEAKRSALPPLNKSTSAKPARPTLKQRKEFVYASSKPLKGVIAHLTLECGGNVHDKGIVNVTASSVYNDTSDYQPKNAVDLGTNSIYESANEKDSWICYNFKERRVIPTSYSVRSHGGSAGYHHLKSWVIEVSNDGSSWTEIDRQDDSNDLNGKYLTAHFKISNVPSEGFRLFRLRQTRENRWGNHYLALSSLEIFGTLFEK